MKRKADAKLTGTTVDEVMVKAAEFLKKKNEKNEYRVRRIDGTFVGAGTGAQSWFTLDKAREIAKSEKGATVLFEGWLETL